MDERLVRLRRKVNEAPASPGVYLHRDAQGKILYVGKARQLQNRLRSYFFGLERHTPKTRALVSRIADFEVIITANEHESLVLENNLIKHHRPPYNILLRDDKTYPFLRIHPGEPWPRLVATRRRRDDGALYFGPYTNGAQLTQVLSVINRFFPLVKCPPSVFKVARRPCNYYHIKKCLGPCSLPVDRAEYGGLVANVVAILEGRSVELRERLAVEMNAAAEALDFERAARLRDQIRAVEGLSDQKQSVFLAPGLDIDIIGAYWQTPSVCFFVSSLRDGRLIRGEHFILNSEVDQFETDAEGSVSFGPADEGRIRAELTESFLCQHYLKRKIPPLVFCPAVRLCLAPERRVAVTRFLDETFASQQEGDASPSTSRFILGGEAAELRNGMKGEAQPWKVTSTRIRSLQVSADENARERYVDHQRIDEQSRRMAEALHEILGAGPLPIWIECFDISTIQGTETVASQVVFRDGRPTKSEYRRYVIKESMGQDDFAAMREVMRRRFKEERRHEVPDLVLVDGGEPQVREVGWTLKSLGLGKIALAGIAKARTEREFASSAVQTSQERLVIPARDAEGDLAPDVTPETRILKVGSPEFRLVTQLRDEAHRFAITLHRKRRDSLKRQSALHRVPGLGPQRRKRILEAFPDLSLLVVVPAGEVAQKAGIPLSLAMKVIETLKAGAQKEAAGA